MAFSVASPRSPSVINANNFQSVSRPITRYVSNEYQVSGFFSTHTCGLRPVYYSCDAPHDCLWRLNDANTSRQGRLDHVTACKTTVSTHTGRHRYHLPFRKSSVWTYFFGRYPICEENCCSAWRHSALQRVQYFRDHGSGSRSQRYRADDGVS